jgi:hypothetical protein
MTYVNNKGGIIMPRGDGTGPTGKGPMTGRGMGFCVRTFETGETSYIGGGIRRGSRRWFGRGCAAVQFLPETEKELLEDEKSKLQRRLESIEKELDKLN